MKSLRTISLEFHAISAERPESLSNNPLHGNKLSDTRRFPKTMRKPEMLSVAGPFAENPQTSFHHHAAITNDLYGCCRKKRRLDPVWGGAALACEAGGYFTSNETVYTVGSSPTM